jgi:hypothetical protein
MDTTEEIRRVMQADLNAAAAERATLEAKHGQVWNTQELQEDFTVLGFMAPFVVIRRNSDGIKGSMQFQHSPRYYFGFKAE